MTKRKARPVGLPRYLPGLTKAENKELRQLAQALHLPGKTGAMVKRAEQLLGKLK